jgi:methionyl-tRNA synthetase
MLRQVSNPCPKCGSHYRRGDLCNACFTYAPVAAERSKTFYESYADKDPKGRIWDSKQHKYKKTGQK